MNQNTSNMYMNSYGSIFMRFIHFLCCYHKETLWLVWIWWNSGPNSFQPNAAFYTETNYLLCISKQILVSIWNASLGWNGFDKLSEIFPNLKRNNASSHLHLVCSHIYERAQNPVVSKSPHCGHNIQNVSAQGIYVSI